MVIRRIAEALRVLQNVLDAVDQVGEELGAFGVAEQRPPDRRYLHQARQGQRGQGARQGMVQVEEEFEGGEVQEGRSPAGRYLNCAEVV